MSGLDVHNVDAETMDAVLAVEPGSELRVRQPVWWKLSLWRDEAGRTAEVELLSIEQGVSMADPDVHPYLVRRVT